MKSRTKGLIFFLVIIILAILIALYVIKTHKKTKQPAHPPKPVATYTTLKKYNIPLTVTTYGYTLSPNSVTVRAPVSGIIKSINFTSGQKVKKGQLLFIINASDITQQLTYLKPQLTEAKAIYDNNVRVNKQAPGSVSKQSLLSLKATYDRYKARYQALYNQTHIRAAIDGRISDTNLAVGDLVSANDDLAYISTKSIIQLSYHLPSQWAPKAKLKQLVTFTNDQQKTFKGYVSYIAPILELNNQGVNVRADMQSTHALTANQFGQIIQTINAKQMTLAIPQSLVQTDAKGYYVVGVKNHKVVNEYFSPGRVTKKGLITVQSGLKVGDKILSNPGSFSVGQKV